ncbi:hypothetical protein CAP31_02670 [Sulfuriferula sp. AH1]|uniref:helix-turn-helix transcriptional regulator n=1 Tax=Sulfuriferula sp. AH1 TaxID=1985873 RepID=UPI000B3B886E|nr:helix-turn-helix domain-containing protein [Sulfuriferula sp. AH1]ARU30685.1 hypothetical protein CAP31_02670 [Sulfuriferula sp. AH1]
MNLCKFLDVEFLKPEDVLKKLKISQAKLYRLVKTHQFPPPVKIGTANRWLASDLEAYLSAQIAATRSDTETEASA